MKHGAYMSEIEEEPLMKNENKAAINLYDGVPAWSKGKESLCAHW